MRYIKRAISSRFRSLPDVLSLRTKDSAVAGLLTGEWGMSAAKRIEFE